MAARTCAALRGRVRLLLVALVVLTGTAACQQQAPPAGHDWPRFGWDAARTDASPDPTGIAASDLTSLQRQQVQLGGTADSSAIYLHDVLVKGKRQDAFFLTTSYGETLAIDAADGTILWRFTPPGAAGWAGSYRVTTASPAADPSRRYIYAAAPDGIVRKLAVEDGSDVWSTAVTRLPAREKITSALNVDRGHVIVTTGGYYGDVPPYQGHVAVLDASSGSILHVWNALCSDRKGLIDPSSCTRSGAAIWARSGAVVEPATGNLLLATGNGRWDGKTNWGDAVVELSPDGSTLLANDTPANTDQLDAADLDLGSTAPLMLTDGLLAQGGKDGRIRLLDLSAMDGTTGHLGGELQTVPTPAGEMLFTALATWRMNGATWLFVADNGGTAAWKVAGRSLQEAWHNAHAGTSPVVAGGLLYVYDPGGGLRVYRPDTGQLLADLASGPGHWNSPIVADGRIALPEGNANAHRTSGVLDIWRLPP